MSYLFGTATLLAYADVGVIIGAHVAHVVYPQGDVSLVGVLGIVGTCVAVGVVAGLWALVRASCQNSIL